VGRLPAYSVVIGHGTGLDGTISLGTPPEGFIWVLRDGLFTFANVIGTSSPLASVQFSEEGPGWQLRDVSSNKSILIGAYTFEWHGRFVVPAGQELFLNTDASCTYYLGGYQLSSLT
jgi:hypothetical protein